MSTDDLKLTKDQERKLQHRKEEIFHAIYAGAADPEVEHQLKRDTPIDRWLAYCHVLQSRGQAQACGQDRRQLFRAVQDGVIVGLYAVLNADAIERAGGVGQGYRQIEAAAYNEYSGADDWNRRDQAMRVTVNRFKPKVDVILATIMQKLAARGL